MKECDNLKGKLEDDEVHKYNKLVNYKWIILQDSKKGKRNAKEIKTINGRRIESIPK